MKKKIAIFACALLMAGTILPTNIHTTILANTADQTAQRDTINAEDTWYKDQLDVYGKKMYKALETLYTNGSFKTGIGEIDLSKEFTQAELKDYAGGKTAIAVAFQAARDAFCQDYPEIFYVDFSKVTLRLGMSNNQYILLLNNGSNANYYTEGFTSAEQVNSAITEVEAIKAEVKSVVTDEMLDNPVNLVTTIHNKLIKMFEYTYPSKANMNVNNVYGALTTGESNCEGYTRTFKWILDDFNIPNVMVGGMAVNAQMSEGKDKVDATMGEAHAWNYVKIENEWYAVDVTWDDPIMVPASKAADKIRTTYLLRGSDTMNENHFAFGQFSPESKKFELPKLNPIDYEAMKGDTSADDDYSEDISTDLKITFEKQIDSEEVDDSGNPFTRTIFHINYKGMTIKELNEQGLYLAYRGTELTTGQVTAWVEVFDGIPSATETDMFAFHSTKAYSYQFCITPLKSKATLYGEGVDLATPGNNILISKWVLTPYYSDYTAPPYIRTSEPAQTRKILPVKTQYRVEYDDELVVVDPNKEVTIKITNTYEHINASANNVKLEYGSYTSPILGKKSSTIVKFDFYPDEKFQGYGNKYSLQLENVVGKLSGKAPNPVRIMTTFKAEIPCPLQYRPGSSANAFLMSDPTLVVDPNMEDIFTTNAGAQSYGPLNIALVAKRVDKDSDKNKELADKLQTSMGIDMLGAGVKSSTYNLSIGCGALAASIKDGYHLSVGLPYPEGYHPDDGEVEFRAYHFKLQSDGTYKPEELICKITPAGLMVIAESFSPFTVIAVPKAEAEKHPSTLTDKAVTAYLETSGGKIETNNGGAGMYTVADGESRTFTVTPDEGYVIDRILLNNVEVKLQDKTSYTTTFDYKKMTNENDLKVYFVAESVVEKEESKGIDPITPVLVDDSVIAPEPTYVDTSLTTGTVGIKGVMLQDSSITLSVDELTTEQTKKFTDFKPGATKILSGTPKISNTAALKGNISLTLTVDDAYKNHNLKLLTLESGEVKEYKAAAVETTVKFENISGLVPFYLVDANVNITALKELIVEYKKLAKADYTDVSFSNFSQILINADSFVKETDPSTVTQEAVSNVSDKLTSAKSALVDVKGLNTILATIESLKEADYTTATFKPLFDSAKEATGLKINGTKEAIDVAIAELNDHFTKLEAKTLNTAKVLLSNTIEKAKKLKMQPEYNNVLSTFKTNFENKLTAAQTVYNNYAAALEDKDGAKVEALNSANQELIFAIQQLSFTADKKSLNDLINVSKALDLTLYVDDLNKAAFEKALAYAKAVSSDTNAVAVTIQQAHDTLLVAKNNLKLISENPKPEVNLEGLANTMKVADKINADAAKYETTGDAWKAYNTALMNAKGVDKTDQAKVDAVVIALNDAIANLRILPTQELANDMAAMITKINNLDLSKYTKEDQLFLINARIKAEAFGKAPYTQSEYDEMIDMLAKAQTVITDNVLKPEDPSPTPKPEDPAPKPEDPTPAPDKPNEDIKDPIKNPEQSNTPVTTPTVKADGAVLPATGDSTNIPMVASAMSVAGILGYMTYRKKRNKK